MRKRGSKHLIQCRCILRTLKSRADPPLHSFVVFSEEHDNNFVERYVTCNNCGVVHRVTGFCTSQIINNFEGTTSSMTKEDIRISLNDGIAGILETYNCSLADYEHIKFMIDNNLSDFIVLSREFNDERNSGKILKHIGSGKFEIEPFSRREYVE